jgi:hypothetical protein
MHKNATKCNETLSKWCKNKHGASKMMDTLETYHPLILVIDDPPPRRPQPPRLPPTSSWAERLQHGQNRAEAGASSMATIANHSTTGAHSPPPFSMGTTATLAQPSATSSSRTRPLCPALRNPSAAGILLGCSCSYWCREGEARRLPSML